MSLIDEALKRAREQTTPPDPAAPQPAMPPEDPWSYAPLPDRRRRSPALGPVAGVVGGIALLGGAAWFLLRPGPSETRRPTSAPTAIPERAPARDPGPPDPAARPVAAAERPDPGAARGRGSRADAPPPDVGQPQGPVSEKVRGGAASPPPVVLSAGIASAPPRPAAANRSRTLLPTEGQTPSERRSAAPGGKSRTGTYVAADGTLIELGGIVFSETNPVALINGRVLPVGGVVGSMTILSISESRVELAGDGAHVFLSVR